MISRLSQYDLVFARREQSIASELRARRPRCASRRDGRSVVARRRRIVLGRLRDAVCGLALARGTFRVLPAMLARRGLRTCQLTLPHGMPPQGATYHASLLGRQAARLARSAL